MKEFSKKFCNGIVDRISSESLATQMRKIREKYFSDREGRHDLDDAIGALAGARFAVQQSLDDPKHIKGLREILKGWCDNTSDEFILIVMNALRELTEEEYKRIRDAAAAGIDLKAKRQEQPQEAGAKSKWVQE